MAAPGNRLQNPREKGLNTTQSGFRVVLLPPLCWYHKTIK